MVRIGFIGAGTVGNALAIRLSDKGYPVVAVASRSESSAKKLAQSVNNCTPFFSLQEVADISDLVFITTPDGAINAVASQIKWHKGQSAVHCSGADTTSVLEPARKLGARVGVFHPLQTFASIQHAVQNLPGSTFCIEAEEPLKSILKDMAVDLGGFWIELEAKDKVLYHAAAVFACNYLVTVVKLATDLWQAFGISQKQAIQALLPLIRGTVNNIENVGMPQCLTGPIARGDTGTILKHLNALEKAAPGLLSAYRELGRQTIPIALAKGRIDQKQAEKMQTMLNELSEGTRL